VFQRRNFRDTGDFNRAEIDDF